MNLNQIVKREAYVQALPMGPERWKADIELTQHKIACSKYRHSSQKISFAEWLVELGAASKTYDTVWADDQVRADYYEGQPSPTDAIDSDRDYWE